MTVSSILRSKGNEVVSAPITASVHDVARLLVERRIGAVVILDDKGELAGIASERDIVRLIGTHRVSVMDRPITSAMTSKVITCTPEHTIAEIMGMMTERRFRHLPVVADGKLCGLVSIGDVVKERIAEAEREAEEMKRYIASGG